MNSFVRHHRESIRFGYHCFDRIALQARIPLFLNPGAIVHFLRQRHKVPAVTPGFLRQISTAYHTWLAAQAERAGVPIIEPPDDPNVRREDWVQPYFQALGSDGGTAVIALRPAMTITGMVISARVMPPISGAER